MKPDTERKKRYNAKLHKKKDFLHVHVSKDLRKKLKINTRSLLIHKGDKVKVMRGFARGKAGKVTRVNYIKVKVYVEGVTKRTARGKEVALGIDPSNLLLLETEMTKERQNLFKEVAGLQTQKVSKEAKEANEKIKADNVTVVTNNEVKS